MTRAYGTATTLRYGRAIVTFVLAYVVITVLAVALALGLEAWMQAPPSADPVHSPSYVLAEKVYPLLNLLVWVAFSWVYFRSAERGTALVREALALGIFWLALALPVDYVGFVLIQNPYSLSAHDFYIGQFPWIYLIYVAVLVSPLCYAAMRPRTSAPSVA